MAWTFGRADDGPHETEDSFAEQRERMVRTQLESRGIRDPRVLAAFRRVPREEFVPVHLKEFAYRDSPLPIEERQTISQPFVVALTCEALELAPDDRVLEVGTGSGYAAAVLAHVASAVYTVERHGPLAQTAHDRLERLGYDNVYVLHGDGTQGWEEHAPYDAIAVAAGGPEPPRSLLTQLAPGGRLVIPVGETPRLQKLVRIRRTPDGFETEDLGDVAFVPLIGAEGWKDDSGRRPAAQPAEPAAPAEPATSEEPTGARLSGPELIGACAEPFETVDDADLAPLLDLPAELIAGAHTLARREGVTPFMAWLAAVATLLSRWTGQDDLVIGTPVANRNRVETEDLIGFFVNMLVLRADLAGDPGFLRLLDEVSYDAPDMDGVSVSVDGEYVRRVLSDIVKNQDLSRYVL